MPASSRIISQAPPTCGHEGVGAQGQEATMGVQQHRKNPLPVVRAADGHGIFLLEHGEPHDPCPVEGCAGALRFAHR